DMAWHLEQHPRMRATVNLVPVLLDQIEDYVRQFDRGEMRDPLLRLKALFASAAPFAALTGREKEVCLRILSGFSSEAIAAELGISLHSALTYRKRAYEKLGISAQNELFGMVLRLMVSRSLN
ncbi:MAG: hypothetical protein DI543_18695, partial [Bradyrhizobium icense]